MSNNGILSKIGQAFILYKFSGMILFCIIVLLMIFFIVSPQVDKEYQKYGYTGLSDNIKYDDWTGEIVPKAEIETFNNDNKYIINSKGEQIKFGQMKELIKQFSEIQGNYASVKADKVERIDKICNTLLRDYLELNYEIVKFGDSGKEYVIEIRGDYEKSYYSTISSSASLRGLVKEVVKDKYRKQNNLDK